MINPSAQTMLADDLAKEAATFVAGSRTRKLLHMAVDALRAASAPAAVRALTQIVAAIEPGYGGTLGAIRKTAVAALAAPEGASTAAGEARREIEPVLNSLMLALHDIGGNIEPQQNKNKLRGAFKKILQPLYAAPPAAQTDGVREDLITALQFIVDGYDNHDVNHVDYRVKVYQVALDALAAASPSPQGCAP